jgi:hypothetical protein
MSVFSYKPTAAPPALVGVPPWRKWLAPDGSSPGRQRTTCSTSFRLRTSAIRLRQTPAGHILVAAVRVALAHHLLLAADQLLAVRWVRSSSWDCYLPAALLNAWHLALAGILAPAPGPMDHPTVHLPDIPC